MLIKIVHLVILFFILSTIAARHSRRDYYSDESSESEEEPRPCGKARCRVYPKQRRQGYPAIKNEEKEDKADNRRADESSGYRRKEDLGDNRRDDNQQSNAFDIVKLLSLFANGNKGETKVSFNIRDIQSGFSNAGSKYRVGNVHREVNRQKRDAESELNDVATLSNGGIETGLVETSDTSTDIAKTENNVNSKELSVQPSAENAQVINDNKSVDANVSHTEADNFQDFNATNIHDFAANDSTSVPVNETASDDFNNEQLLTKEPNKEDNNNSINETSQVDNSNHYLERSSSDSFNQSENNVSRIGLVRDAEEISNNESNDEINTSQSQPPKVKMPLSRKGLSNIQSTLNDEFGVPSNGANPVANFALNPLNNKKQVIVIVYNCTCGKNNPHSHEKSIDDAVLINNNNDTNNNDEDLPKVILNTRRMIPSDPISSAQIEEEPTEENVENTNSEDKPNYAQLENNMLKECTSLLAFQTKNKVDEETDTNSENTTAGDFSNEDFGAIISPEGDNVENNSFYSENESNNSSNNSDTFDNITQNNDYTNNGTITPVEIEKDTVNTENVNYDNAEVDQDTNTNVNQAVSVSESLDAVNNQENGANLPTSDVIEDHNQRRRRSLLQDNLKNKTTEIFNHEKLSEELLNLLKVGDMSPNKFIGKYLQKHDNVKTERKRRSIRRKLIKYFNKKNLRSKREVNLIDFLNNFVTFNSDKEYRPTKISNPKYYEYLNDKPNLLDDTNSEETDGTVVNFKPYEEIKSKESNEQNKNENILGSFLDEVKNLSNGKPMHVNVYLQLLLKK